MGIRKIIHVINHPPAYEEYSNKPRPKINWDTSDGKWVGIWGYDWADQIANECLRINNNFEHEVWQPDLRADKIYSYTFENGLTHRLFPARYNYTNEIISPLMQTFIDPEKIDQKIIFHISYPHFFGLNKNLLNKYKDQKFVLTFHGEIILPINYLFRIQKNPFKKIFYLKQHYTAKKYFQLLHHITYVNDKNLKTLKKYYKGKLTKITMGIDTNKFKIIDKKECRNKLNLSNNRNVLLTVSRFVDIKQIDKLIEILSEIDKNFILLIVGHGTRKYETYLKNKARVLLKKNKIRFEGYKPNEQLVEYYNAADLFIHVSKSEAGPVCIMEAMACGLPIFCTDVGNTAEFLKENNAGIIVGIKDYKDWKKKIEEFLNGKKPKIVDINLVKDRYDWGNIAQKFLKIYEEI